jgi:hypothetical protein
MKRFCLDFASTLFVAFGLLIAINSQGEAQAKPILVALCTNVNCRWSGADGGCVGGCTAAPTATCECTSPPVIVNGVPCYCEAS